MNPILVLLQLIFSILSLELGVNKARIINGAAEEGSPGIFKSNPKMFFCPFNEIKCPLLIFFIFISAFTLDNKFSV